MELTYYIVEFAAPLGSFSWGSFAYGSGCRGSEIFDCFVQDVDWAYHFLCPADAALWASWVCSWCPRYAFRLVRCSEVVSPAVARLMGLGC